MSKTSNNAYDPPKNPTDKYKSLFRYQAYSFIYFKIKFDGFFVEIIW